MQRKDLEYDVDLDSKNVIRSVKDIKTKGMLLYAQ